MNINKRLLPLVLLGIIHLSIGCNSPNGQRDIVTITYEQVGCCNGYPQTTGPGGSGPHTMVNVGPNAAYAAFKILKFDNSKSSQDFQFDPTRLYINQTPRAHMSTSLSFTRDLGVFAALPVTIPKGKVQGNNGIVVTVVSTAAANGASEANNTSYFLLHDTAANGPGVILEKKNPAQLSWPVTENCLHIRF